MKLESLNDKNLVATSTDFIDIMKALTTGQIVCCADMSFAYYMREDKTVMYVNRVFEDEATEVRFIKNVPFKIYNKPKRYGYKLCKDFECKSCPLNWLCKESIKSQLVVKTYMCLYNVLDLLTKEAPEDIKKVYLSILDKEVE